MKAAAIAIYIVILCSNARSSSSLKQQLVFDTIKDTDADAGKSNLFLRRRNIYAARKETISSTTRFLEPMSMMSIDIHDFSFSMTTFSMTTTIDISGGTPCGDGNVGNGTCRTEGDCCSKYGWCGRTADHCDGGVSIASSTASPSLKPTTGDPTTAPTTDKPTTMKVTYELVSIISSTTSPSLKPTSNSPTDEEPTIEPTYIRFPVTDHPVATTPSPTPSLINCKWTEAYENTEGRGKCATEEKFFVPYNCYGDKSYKICCTASFISSPFESEEYGTCYKVYQWSYIEGIVQD